MAVSLTEKILVPPLQLLIHCQTEHCVFECPLQLALRDTICPDLLLLLVIDELHDIIQKIHLSLMFVLLLGQYGVKKFQGDLVIICDLELLNRYVREDHRLLYQILLLYLKQDPLDNIEIFL